MGVNICAHVQRRMKMAQDTKSVVDNIARGRQVHKDTWTLVIGKQLFALPEDENVHDQHTVVVIRDDKIVQHVPCS